MKTYHRIKILVLGIFLIGLLVILQSYPGQMHMDWLGYRLQMSVSLFLFILVLVVFILILLGRMIKAIIQIPLYLLNRHQKRKQRKAEDAFIDGIVAISAGEFGAAEKCAQVATKFLPTNPLGYVVSAQAAFMQGKVDEASHCFQKLQEYPETSFLGLRGEAIQARQDGNWSRAKKALHKALKLRPHSPWALQQLLEADLRLGSYHESLMLLKRLHRDKVTTQSSHQRYRALVYWLRAKEAERDQDSLLYLRKSHDAAPDLVEIACTLASREIKSGHHNRAKKIIARSWFVNPHTCLLETYRLTFKDPRSVDFYRALKDLKVEREDTFERHLLLATAALEAKLWGQARHHLQNAHSFKQTRQSCQLFATLIRGEEPHDHEKANLWDQKALFEDDYMWVCQQCQNKFIRWDAFCPSCGSLDSIVWSLSGGTPPMALLSHFL